METSPEPESHSAPQKRNIQPQMRLIAGASLAVVLIGIVAFAGTVSVANQKQTDLIQTSNALSAALVEPVLMRDRGKLALLVQRLATEGGFQKVTITDPEGAVLASTDTTLQGQSIPQLKKPPIKPITSHVGGSIVIDRGIFVGPDTAIGGLEIVALP